MEQGRGSGAVRRATLALCGLCGPATTLEASACWDDCGLDQLLFGEWPIGAGRRGKLLPDVNTAQDDWPCLDDVLRQAALRSAEGWLLLLPAEALPSAALLRAMLDFLATQPSPRLVLGRAWRVSAECWATLRSSGSRPEQDSILRQALREEGILDPPGEISLVLLPREALSGAPADLSAAPRSAAAWLARRARECGWPVMDATWSAPLVRPASMDSPLQGPARRPIPSDGLLPAEKSGGPLLSFLLVGERDRLQLGLEHLLPTATLPWEVVAREVPIQANPGGVAAAWNDALPDAQGELIWPLWNRVPKPGTAATLLRCFEPGWVDLVITGFRIGTELMAPGDPTQIPPGTLVVRRQWLERLGGFPAADSPTQCLLRLRRDAVARGATQHPLPLEVLER